DRGKRPCVYRRVRGKQTIQMEDVRRNRINIFVTQGLRRVLRHGAADIIEQGRSIRPIAADGFHGPWRRERALPADQLLADTAFALFSVTGSALPIKDLAAVTDAAAARRKVVTVAIDIDIPARDLPSRRGAPDAV